MSWIAAVLGALVCGVVWAVAGDAIAPFAERLTRPVRRLIMRRLARFRADTVMRVVWPVSIGLTVIGLYVPARPGLLGVVGGIFAVGAIPAAAILHLVLRDRDAASVPPPSSNDG